MKKIWTLTPLLLAAAVLLAGNGLLGTVIATRGSEEGMAAGMIGLMGTSYYAGFILACVFAPKLIQTVGHIRVFAALAAVSAAGTLVLVLVIDAWVWVVLRLFMGFCFSGIFMVIESWLNASASNEDRARIVSIYRLVDLAAVAGGQFLMPLFGISGWELFAVLAILFAMSLVPVSLGDRSRPKAPVEFHFDLKAVWLISPMACIGCVSIGLTNSAFRLVGPLYGQEIGLDVAQVATFISAGIVGGAVLQYPLGMLSDRVDRRTAVIIATAGAALSGLFLSWVAGTSPMLNYIGIFVFGAFALPLYSLSASHANDHANDDQYVLVAAGLSFFFSAGAMAGPAIVSVLVSWFGPSAMFTYTSAVHGLLIIATLWRMAARPAVPRGKRKGFMMLLRTSPVIFRLARGDRLNGNS